MKAYGPIFVNLREKRREGKNKTNSLTSRSNSHVRLHLMDIFRFFILFIIIIIILLLLYYYLTTWLILPHLVSFLPRKKIYLFSFHFILNELSSSHFLSSEIFVKSSSLKSLTVYHSENRKIFRLSLNSTKLFWVTKFHETNLTAQSVSLSET